MGRVWASSAGFVFFFQAEDGIRDVAVTGVQTCALPISPRDLLVEHSLDDEGKHFRLAWRQRLITTAQVRAVCLLRTREPIAIERLLNRIEQILIAKRLRQKLYRTGFHRAYGHRNIAMPGDEDDGKVNVCLAELAL